MVFCLFDITIGYTNTSPIYTHITYIFQHASILHLTLNSLAFISVYTSLERLVNKYVFVGLSFASSIIASFMAMYNTPTVGASSMIYAMIGIYVYLIFTSNKMKMADTIKYLPFMICIVFSLAISYFKENSNFLLHIYSLAIGVFCGFIIRIKTNAPFFV